MMIEVFAEDYEISERANEDSHVLEKINKAKQLHEALEAFGH